MTHLLGGNYRPNLTSLDSHYGQNVDEQSNHFRIHCILYPDDEICPILWISHILYEDHILTSLWRGSEMLEYDLIFELLAEIVEFLRDRWVLVEKMRCFQIIGKVLNAIILSQLFSVSFLSILTEATCYANVLQLHCSFLSSDIPIDLLPAANLNFGWLSGLWCYGNITSLCVLIVLSIR